MVNKPRPKKTFPVMELRNHVNKMLKMDITKEERTIISIVLEKVLMDTGNYHGFRYLETHEYSGNGQPGMNFPDHKSFAELHQIGEETAKQMQFENTDPTRREYY